MNAVQDIRAICGGIRERFAVSAVAMQAGLKLERSGSEWKARCPSHSDRTASLFIFDGDRRWICFAGCGGGDVLDLVKLIYRVGLPGAIALLDQGALSQVTVRPVRAKAKPDHSEAASRIWRSAGPVLGTPAEAYLRSRGISMAAPWTIRFGLTAPPKDSGVRAANGAGPLPALIALVSDAGGRGVGVQRTYLTSDGHKAASADGKVKFSLGPIVGGAIHVGPAAEEMIVTEGLEDGLTLAEQLRRSVWVAAGTSMMPRMALPEIATSIVIGADGDAPGETAAQNAARAFAHLGRAVRIMRPAPGFKDFNAQLMGVRS